ncbi:MAG: geranylgeranyl pyrophosphate synthase [Candidatus Saccharibacteria bacterium]|nr:geranylgeranyl pyrophosphate synthase [Candidatus Saccharibacteria bacterium]
MLKNTFIDFAEGKRPLIDTQLQLIFKQQRAAARSQNAPYYDLVKQLSVLVARGGKRLRPLLCLLAYESYGGRRKLPIMRVAASQELLHAFLLIHDDIIDRDYHRWGGHNILGVYFDRYSRTMMPRDALHAAEAQALLAGDTCAAMANQVLMASGFEPQLLMRTQQIQQQTIITEIGGEVADTAYPYSATMPTEAQVLQMYCDKTASYSLALPLRLGALLAGADNTELDQLTRFANDHGVAFQLQDDLLGMFGDERKTGKPTIGDLREGKRTVLVTKTLELASPTVCKQFLKLLGNDAVDESSLKRAQTIMIDTGAREYVEQLAYEYSERSLQHLVKTTMNGIGKRRLIDLMALLANRDH